MSTITVEPKAENAVNPKGIKLKAMGVSLLPKKSSYFLPYSKRFANLLTLPNDQMDLLKEYIDYPILQEYIIIEFDEQTKDIKAVKKTAYYPDENKKKELLGKS